jgi:FtsH-binding integral membrane protein
VKLRDNLTLTLAALALVLAIVQMIHPIGFNIHPWMLIVVALLLGLGHLMRKQRQSREELLKDVPAKPLGIADESDQRTNE